MTLIYVLLVIVVIGGAVLWIKYSSKMMKGMKK